MPAHAHIACGFVMLEDGLGLHLTQAVPTLDIAQAEQIMLAYASRRHRL